MERQKVVRQVEDSIRVKRSLAENADALLEIADQMARALKNGNKVVLFGNGGSAADAEHIATELAGKFARDRAPLATMALSASTTAITAIANDYGYENVFARQVKGLVRPGDVVVGISTSGQSQNVIMGIEEANRLGAVTVAFSGNTGRLRKIARYVLEVPSKDTPRIQEAHITAGHIICGLVEDALFGTEDSKL
jgi:D-sedoheptulose 7-phosphate isomerase